MNYVVACLIPLAAALPALAQPKPTLTIETIMQDPRYFVGTAPSGVFWSEDSQTIYFNWNVPGKAAAPGDSLYKLTLAAGKGNSPGQPVKVGLAERRNLPPATDRPIYNRARTLRLYEKYGDIYLINRQTGQQRVLTNTVDRESNPVFSGDEKAVLYTRAQNLYRLELSSGLTEQLTNFDAGSRKPDRATTPTTVADQEAWLKRDQLALFDVLRQRKEKREQAERSTKAEQPRRPKQIFTDGRTVLNPTLSPNARVVTFALLRPATGAKATIVPNYLTESGFTEDLPARTKVGAPLAAMEFMVYDVARDTAITVSMASLPGITDKPGYLMPAAVTAGPAAPAGSSTAPVSETLKAAVGKDTTRRVAGATKTANRPVYVSAPVWAEGAQARYGVVVIRATDNKDRWLMLLDTEKPTDLTLLDRQRDEAWVGGPGIGSGALPGTLGWLDEQTIYFQSEADGYSHLYTLNVLTGQRTQLTSGRFEVQQVSLSADKQTFYLITNEQHPGEQHLYRMAGRGGPRTRLSSLTGAHEATLAPDETRFAVRYSAITKPWELMLLPNSAPVTDAAVNRRKRMPVAAAGNVPGPASQLTTSTTPDFQAYPWRTAEVVPLPARDGELIYARLYKPTSGGNGKAVVFVHGAGYLQNAHKWWSQYFREYMFHNLLVDKGYTVLDIDYRASAGYINHNTKTEFQQFQN